jgi:hypothetical protein
MKIIWLKIICSVIVLALLVVQQFFHTLIDPQLVTVPPPEWTWNTSCYSSIISYYGSAVKVSTIFGLIYVVIILLLLWLSEIKKIFNKKQQKT